MGGNFRVWAKGLRWAAVAVVVAVAGLTGPDGRVASALAEEAGGGFVGLEVQGADGLARRALGYDTGFGGVLVRDVAPGGPGDAAGLRRGDLILAFEGVAINGLQQLVGYMQATEAGKTVSFDIWRRGKRDSHSLTLGPWPEGWRIATNATAVVPRLGATLAALTPEQRQNQGVRWGVTGVVVTALEEGGAGVKAGLRPRDVIVAVGRQRVVAPAAVDEALAAQGDDWMVLVQRGNQVALLGPGAPDPADVVAGEDILAVALADGPYVLDRTPQAPDTLRPGDTLDALPAAAALPAPARHRLEDIGLTVVSLSAEARAELAPRWSSRGAMVASVAPNSVAQRTGLAPGHVIRSLNQEPVRDPEDLATRMAEATAPHVLLVVETAQGFRLLSLGLAEEEAQAPAAVTPVFDFGAPAGPG